MSDKPWLIADVATVPHRAMGDRLFTTLHSRRRHCGSPDGAQGRSRQPNCDPALRAARLHVSRRAIVVIAARDTAHITAVMTRDDWNSVRRCDPLDRNQLLRECVIENHARCLQILASN